MSFDPRLLTGPSLIVIGAVFLFLGLRLWIVHPVNRVLRLGPFVTEEGLGVVIRLRVLLTNLGLFFLTNGAASVRFWFVADRKLDDPIVAVLGGMAGVFAVSAAIVTLHALWRWWRA